MDGLLWTISALLMLGALIEILINGVRSLFFGLDQ